MMACVTHKVATNKNQLQKNHPKIKVKLNVSNLKKVSVHSPRV